MNYILLLMLDVNMLDMVSTTFLYWPYKNIKFVVIENVDKVELNILLEYRIRIYFGWEKWLVIRAFDIMVIYYISQIFINVLNPNSKNCYASSEFKKMVLAERHVWHKSFRNWSIYHRSPTVKSFKSFLGLWQYFHYIAQWNNSV